MNNPDLIEEILATVNGCYSTEGGGFIQVGPTTIQSGVAGAEVALFDVDGYEKESFNVAWERVA